MLDHPHCEAINRGAKARINTPRIVLLLALLLASSCGVDNKAGDPNEKSIADTSNEAPATTVASGLAERTTPPQPSPGELPESTLSFGDQSTTGSPVSACWPPSGEEGACVDGPARLPEEAVVAPSGSALELEFGGRERVSSVLVTATPIETFGTPGHPRTELRASQENPAQVFLDDLPPGEYALNVYFKAVDEASGNEGTAPYVFRVLVQ